MYLRRTVSTLTQVTLLISTIGYFTNWSPTHIAVSLINFSSATVFSWTSALRSAILTFRFTEIEFEWRKLHDNLPHFNTFENHSLTFKNTSTATCPVLSLKEKFNITFPKHNLLDDALAVNNFRWPGIIKVAEDVIENNNFDPTSLINSFGALYAFNNEMQGTHSLLKKIMAFSENHTCPSVEEFAKVLEFSQSNVWLENTIYYSTIELWTKPVSVFVTAIATCSMPSYLTLIPTALKAFKNFAFAFRDVACLEFFQEFIKVALIPYWEANGCIEIAPNCMPDPLNEKCFKVPGNDDGNILPPEKEDVCPLGEDISSHVEIDIF